ncbi:TPA: HAD family hydrolase [Pasteurella multocida]|uniref:HAD family hydrolase n=1 Tax=Pasteurella multocida TaxID=747 RepID=UPI00201FCA28|nr:HAD hydrolase-like protein [Pasteurella multocida]MCL7796603.1 HAD hydrolase-like protein [Pasteurella multocida]MCL7801176.1 HAD hydrolase-like protein [Pasteurella multocida]MDG2541756.1 HAD hydrolase-like protein [Pasteurella multocida]URH95767.1 HAD hydrolase-like protein [Pasteurella multocida]WND43500.1 HAD hydrolase-like protein [Pasteurella multocida]
MTTQYQKQKTFVICIDSDGCVMDTMDIKHQHCFGPYLSEVFGLSDEKRFLNLWDHINLYSQTRGINRFRGLVMALTEYGYEKDFSALKHWVETSNELSNRALIKRIEQHSSEDLQLALLWSEKVNAGIQQLRCQDKPFPSVKRSLAILKQFADIAVVSSANNEAIIDEWTRHELLPFVDVVYGQEQGTKAYCINQLKKLGYLAEHILMVGDSPGDLAAAKEAGVHFFPILCRHEDTSWDQLVLEALGKLVYQNFDANYQKELIIKFNHNLSI